MKKTLLALATSAISTIALAQSTNVITTSASQSTWSKIKENFSFSYYAELAGREFSDAGNSSKESIYSSVNFGYNVGKGRISVNPRFTVYETSKDAKGQDRDQTQMKNPRVGYSQVLYSNDAYSIFNSSRLEIAVTDRDKDLNHLVKLKQYNSISFNLNSRNTLDFGVELYRWITDGPEAEAETALGIYAEVIHKYAFTDRTALLSIFEYDTVAANNSNALAFHRADEYSIIKVGPEFALNDNLTLYTAAFAFMDQDGKILNDKTANLFISISASI